ncbi:MAG: hypothetical protein L0Z50_07315 [Verrucomicrobiales bacterium]|nr:hypothetical protein [Verrucomicrobiales bacterium]
MKKSVVRELVRGVTNPPATSAEGVSNEPDSRIHTMLKYQGMTAPAAAKMP